jgi:transposase
MAPPNPARASPGLLTFRAWLWLVKVATRPCSSGGLVPALPSSVLEPLWVQFAALLPARQVHHPLGCHRRRIPDRVVFDKLIQVLVFGCGYRRIADATCSATTLRRRRDEWISGGVAERLRVAVLAAYDHLLGLELEQLAVDGCITKAPCGGQVAGPSPGGPSQARPETVDPHRCWWYRGSPAFSEGRLSGAGR